MATARLSLGLVVLLCRQCVVVEAVVCGFRTGGNITDLSAYITCDAPASYQNRALKFHSATKCACREHCGEDFALIEANHYWCDSWNVHHTYRICDDTCAYRPCGSWPEPIIIGTIQCLKLRPTPAPTSAPATSSPTTGSPTTSLPTTALPTTLVPTSAPTTSVPTTSIPTTSVPTTSLPTTAVPTTSVPTTIAPTTSLPSLTPTHYPTTLHPTTLEPTRSPTQLPTALPSYTPTEIPIQFPTAEPSFTPTFVPSQSPSVIPSKSPSTTPTEIPSNSPTELPSNFPTDSPSLQLANASTQASSNSNVVVAVVVVVLLFLIVVIVVFLRKRSRNSDEHKSDRFVGVISNATYAPSNGLRNTIVPNDEKTTYLQPLSQNPSYRGNVSQPPSSTGNEYSMPIYDTSYERNGYSIPLSGDMDSATNSEYLIPETTDQRMSYLEPTPLSVASKRATAYSPSQPIYSVPMEDGNDVYVSSHGGDLDEDSEFC